MAKRLILSMLALLTGLFAQIAPAQAQPRAAEASEIGMVLGARVASETVSLTPLARTEMRADSPREDALPMLAQADARPGALIGIDRARE